MGLRDRYCDVGVGSNKQEKEKTCLRCVVEINYRFSDLVNLPQQAAKCIVFWICKCQVVNGEYTKKNLGENIYMKRFLCDSFFLLMLIQVCFV